MVAGRDKVARLEQAIAAMEDSKGPAMDARNKTHRRCLWNRRSRPGKHSSRGHGRGSSTSTKNEPQKFSESRSPNVGVQQAKPSLPPVDVAGEVARLQQMVSDLQRQLQHQGGLVVAPAIVPSRIRKREDYVPSTDQEFLEWMADRQEDMNAALMAGNPAEAARVSGVITDATRSLQSVTMQPSMITNRVN